MTHDNKLQVEAIKCGTVIDHIPAQIGFKLLTLFKLTATDQRITIGLNLPSNELGRKDLIKIENTFLTEQQANQLAMYAPKATVNRIDNYEVVRKLTLSLPDHIDGVLPEQQLHQPQRAGGVELQREAARRRSAPEVPLLRERVRASGGAAGRLNSAPLAGAALLICAPLPIMDA